MTGGRRKVNLKTKLQRPRQHYSGDTDYAGSRLTPEYMRENKVFESTLETEKQLGIFNV